MGTVDIHGSRTVQIKATNSMKQQARKLGRKVRSGRATAEDDAAFNRIDRALAYISTRHNRNRTRAQAWYDLPMARHIWEADAKDNGK